MNPATNSTASAERSTLGKLARTSIGAKWVMAITGVLFLLWLIGHLVGNLQVFAGSEVLNSYAALLKANPSILWTIRIGLIVVVALHVWAGMRLAQLNRQARPVGYQGYKYREASWASRTMPWSGIVILAFVIFHLLHFTIGTILPSSFDVTDAAGRHDVYRMLVEGFSRPWVTLFYVVAMVLVGLHLSHGIWSSTQTFGLNGTKWTPFFLKAGKWLGILIAVGFIIIPLAVLFGLVGLS